MNPFLTGEHSDTSTALLLEKAYVTDIKNSIAYTDGKNVFVNTEENLSEILPVYNEGVLKWILWHEEMHKKLNHHARYREYMYNQYLYHDDKQFKLTHEEVNIIMDILAHDSLTKMFPELVEMAKQNMFQLRNRNVLLYTFKTYTLEEMLEEYQEFKDSCPPEEQQSDDPSDTDSGSDSGSDSDKDTSDSTPKHSHTDSDPTPPMEGESDGKSKDTEVKTPTEELKDEHTDANWEVLEHIDTKEFITKDEADDYIREIDRLKNLKISFGRLTQKLNGLVTNTRQRTYRMPSSIHVGGGVLLKGSQPGKTALYLCFDASGSMGNQLKMFKDIISRSIPQAMNTPCEWFSGWAHTAETERKLQSTINHDRSEYDYHKGVFKDMMGVYASSGYRDDGDRVIELCYQAEQKGYTPIGVTDGGGRLSWSADMLKKLKNTILVGQSSEWLEEVKKVNPKIQTLHIDI